MPAYIDQSFEEFQNQIHISNLPTDVNVKQVTNLFDQFGKIIKVHLKRRIVKNAPSILPNPFIILIYEKRVSIDEIMSQRPFFLNDYQLFIHRCLPITRRYPYEAQIITNKILLRIPRENHHEFLPKDNIILDYFKSFIRQILRFERFDDKTLLIEFDDYDPVDICCLSRPHRIRNQLVEIEKCPDEQIARRRVQYQQRSRPISAKLSSPFITNIGNCDLPSSHFISPTLTLNINEHMTQLRLIYVDRSNQLENEHEQLIASLKTEWEQIVKERIRLQRLTLDYQSELQSLAKQNHHWKNLYNENIIEQSQLQQIAKQILSNIQDN
ncbi:hypothetical protein I4U23_017684 [Adineta vaga]|nr:hypothetical protein I4U23_017684 [Adineta vaga]